MINPLAHAMRQVLDAREKWLLVVLADRADAWGGSIYFAIDTIAEIAGMSRNAVKRAFRELIKQQQIKLEVPATPTSPAFYRILNVPEPIDPKPSAEGCPGVLRKAVLHFFPLVCSWCQTAGTKDLGGDGRPWAVTLIDPTKYAGRYVPDNVTRSCAFCARKKTREVTASVRALTDVAAVSDLTNKGVQNGPPTETAEGVHDGPRDGSNRTPRGSTVDPDPDLDPGSDPVQKKQGRRPGPPSQPVESPDDNIGVITVIAHEVIDTLGPNHPDLAEAVKSLCATRHIDYNSAVVTRAIESAIWQLKHRGPQS